MKLKLKSGETVIDRYNSHLHQEIMSLLPEALSMIESKGRSFICEELDFGRIIGKTICVAVRPGDQIVYAKRSKRNGFSCFVKNREPELTPKAVVILKTADRELGSYVLVTAFIGGLAEPEPWDERATSKSRNFWNSHALVWGYEEIIPGTEITDCPW